MVHRQVSQGLEMTQHRRDRSLGTLQGPGSRGFPTVGGLEWGRTGQRSCGQWCSWAGGRWGRVGEGCGPREGQAGPIPRSRLCLELEGPVGGKAEAPPSTFGACLPVGKGLAAAV